MYSKISSIIINGLFGFGLFWSILGGIVFYRKLFRYGIKDITFIGGVTFLWMLMFYTYNRARYLKAVEYNASYDKTSFILTTVVPLLIVTAVLLIIFFNY